jgi:hypothetical protein
MAAPNAIQLPAPQWFPLQLTDSAEFTLRRDLLMIIFPIVIGDALDGFAYLHAAPLQVSESLIRPQLFSFFVPWRVGIVVGHGHVLPSGPRYAL